MILGFSRHYTFSGIYAGLISGNAAAWLWALVVFRHYPVLLATSFLAYGFGLRHAVDADHIAAIDNVTRKLMHEGQRPATVGLFFSLGHSTIVVLASVAIAATATVVKQDFSAFQHIAGLIGSLTSSLVLFAVAAMNIVILATLWRTLCRVKTGLPYVEEDLNALLAGRGLLSRFFRPLFGMIRRDWHIYFLGFLFGLGFDTATEVGLLGISAAQAARGLSIWSILVFPALFTAGMSLVDTTDGLLMVNAYGWAFVNPLRKLCYNITITLMSVVVALLIGGIEALGLAGDRFRLPGLFWSIINVLSNNLTAVGFLIVAAFALSWGISTIIYRMYGCDDWH